uniref:Uncharacterized protein n=2 Tax=Lygus hesperus TaxID=30085 RepID=A0A146L0B8_LYGHE
MLTATIAFMDTPAEGAIGGIDATRSCRQDLAKQSLQWWCPTCKSTCDEMFPTGNTPPITTLPPLLPTVDASDDTVNSSTNPATTTTISDNGTNGITVPTETETVSDTPHTLSQPPPPSLYQSNTTEDCQLECTDTGGTSSDATPSVPIDECDTTTVTNDAESGLKPIHMQTASTTTYVDIQIIFLTIIILCMILYKILYRYHSDDVYVFNSTSFKF